VAFLQNHDQVGNRALGERLSHLVSPGRARIGAALLLTAPYVPLLFAGEEWAASTPFRYFTSHTDSALATAVREGRRAEFAAFGWDPELVPDPQDPATFLVSRLDWSEREDAEHASMFAWYRDLIALRRSTPVLHDGERSAVEITGASDGVLTVRRGPVTVAVNLGTDPCTVPLEGSVRLAWPAELPVTDAAVILGPDAVVIMSRA
jgi:maltooligosyltrehalose trehalohydrolase